MLRQVLRPMRFKGYTDVLWCTIVSLRLYLIVECLISLRVCIAILTCERVIGMVPAVGSARNILRELRLCPVLDLLLVM